MNPQAVGVGEADDFGHVSTRDADATRDFALELHRRHPVSGVMTMASESSIAVAAVADALGLPGLDPDVARAATHKGRRQEVFRHAGVPSPRFSLVSSLDQARQACRSIGLPAVVKPVDSAGSRGVRKIMALDELSDAVEEIRSISTTDELVVEEFLTGTEHSIEGVVIDGRIRWTGFSDRNYANKESAAPYFLEDGDTLPTALEDTQVAAVFRAATGAVEALRIDWGPVKGDILVDASGPKILEMAARLSGDYFCDQTVPLHNGIELVPVVMDLSLGRSISIGTLQPRFERGVALRGIWPPTRRIAAVRGIENARRLPGVHFVTLDPGWHHCTYPVECGPLDRIAAVLAHGPTRQEAVERAEGAVAAVEIVAA